MRNLSGNKLFFILFIFNATMAIVIHNKPTKQVYIPSPTRADQTLTLRTPTKIVQLETHSAPIYLSPHLKFSLMKNFSPETKPHLSPQPLLEI